MATATKEIHATQLRHKRNFVEKVKLPLNKVSTGSLVFIWKDFHPTDEPNHNLASIATGPHKDTEKDDKICVILGDNNVTERITLDRIVLAPQVELPQHNDAEEAGQPQGIDVPIRSTNEGKGILMDNDHKEHPGIITRSMVKESQSDTRETEKETIPTTEPVEEAEYTIQKIVDQEPQDDDTNLYRVRWYSYGEDENTLKPTRNLPRSKVVQYYRAKMLPNPQDLSM